MSNVHFVFLRLYLEIGLIKPCKICTDNFHSHFTQILQVLKFNHFFHHCVCLSFWNVWWNKKPTRKTWSPFCTRPLLLGMGPALDTVYILRGTPLEKAGFPFPSRYEVQIVFWLGAELCVHFPFSVPGFSGLNPCRSWASCIRPAVSGRHLWTQYIFTIKE